MSLILLNRRFEKLSDKEKSTNIYFDPNKKQDQHQHRHADDLLKDKKEEMKNYGFQRYNWKNNKEYQMMLEEQKEFNQESLENFPGTDKKDEKRASLTSYLSFNDKRPGSAVKNRPQTAASMGRLNGSPQPVSQFRQTESVMKESKGWKNTKKFDIDYKDLVRNASAISELQFKSGVARREVDPKDEVIVRRFNEEKLLSENSTDKRVIFASQSVKGIIRMGISEEEKEDNYVAFRDACEFLNLKNIHDDLSPSLKVIKSPRAQPPQGKAAPKPQLLSNKTNKSMPVLREYKGNGILSETSVRMKSNTSHDRDVSLNDPRSLRKRDMQYVKENFELLTNPQAILQQMREINALVFASEKAFMKNISEASALEKEKWDEITNGEKELFTSILIDVHSMATILVRNSSVSDIGGFKVIKKKKEINYDIKTLLNCLGELRRNTENQVSQEGCLYYFMIISESEAMVPGVKYEKFIYFGTVGQPMEAEISEKICLFYLRFLMSYDKNEKLTLAGVLENSQVIIANKRKIPVNLQKFFDKLKNQYILIDDRKFRKKHLVHSILLRCLCFEESKLSSKLNELKTFIGQPKTQEENAIKCETSQQTAFDPYPQTGSLQSQPKSGMIRPGSGFGNPGFLRNESYATSERLPSDIFEQLASSQFDDAALNQYLRPRTAVTASVEASNINKSGVITMKTATMRPRTANLYSQSQSKFKTSLWSPKSSIELVKGFQKKEQPKRNTSPASHLSVEGRSVGKLFK